MWNIHRAAEIPWLCAKVGLLPITSGKAWPQTATLGSGFLPFMFGKAQLPCAQKQGKHGMGNS